MVKQTISPVLQRLEQYFCDRSNESTSLDLSGLDLDELPSILKDLMEQHSNATSRLTLLNLAHNGLTNLPEWLSNFSNLRILFLLGNKFTLIPAVIQKIPCLRMLSFKENQLCGVLEASALPPDLTWLILTSNRITGLSNNFGKRCHRVRKLMLSNNIIKSLPPLHEHMHQLELLRLANNALAEFPYDLMKLPKLSWLAMSGNPATGNRTNIDDLPRALRVTDLEKTFDVDWEHPLGTGASGTGYCATDRRSGEEVVVKRFRAAQGSDGCALDEVAMCCSAIGVPNTVQTSGFFYDFNCKFTLDLIMHRVHRNPQPLAGPPSFESCVRSVYNVEHCLSAKEKSDIISAIETAVDALHKRNICHGDLYAHNILISKGSNGTLATLADFGAAWRIPDRIKNEVVAVEHRALEILKREVTNLL